MNERDPNPAPVKSTELSDLGEPDDARVRGGGAVEPCWRPGLIIPCVKNGR